jgi:hypothetical protein
MISIKVLLMIQLSKLVIYLFNFVYSDKIADPSLSPFWITASASNFSVILPWLPSVYSSQGSINFSVILPWLPSVYSSQGSISDTVSVQENPCQSLLKSHSEASICSQKAFYDPRWFTSSDFLSHGHIYGIHKLSVPLTTDWWAFLKFL